MSHRPASHRASTLERRDALIEAAIALTGEKGPAALTHRSVAARAGVPPATVAYFFESLDELRVAAMRRTTDDAVTQLATVRDRVDPVSRHVDDLVDRALEVLFAEPEARRIAQYETYLEAARRPELRPDVSGAIQSYEDFVKTTLIALGHTAPVAAQRAKVAVALVDGFMLQRLAARRDGVHAESLRTALRDLIAP
ncbi:TetR family transcriptional regulator [Mycolicibacterium parafortuitum]|uniref:TetR/AcrR family transcriptional regulator n=1 Tax=Mycolicibacterium parafortuitum TaxID=39692 RepID=UPI0032C4A9FB